MNVIYINEALQYCEAYPERNGIVTLRERHLIVGFVDKGMQYALKDDNNSILTPFETFVQFNDMSINLVSPHFFQPENRQINIRGAQFCELKQVFNCALFVSENDDLSLYTPDSNLHYYRKLFYNDAISELDYLDVKRVVDGVESSPVRIDLSQHKYNVIVLEDSLPLANADYKYQVKKKDGSDYYVTEQSVLTDSIAQDYIFIARTGADRIETANEFADLQINWKRNEIQIIDFDSLTFVTPVVVYDTYQGDQTNKIAIDLYIFDNANYDRLAPERDGTGAIQYQFEGLTYLDGTLMYVLPDVIQTVVSTVNGVERTWNFTMNALDNWVDLVADPLSVDQG